MGLLDDISDNISSMDDNQRSAMNRGLLAMGLNMLATPGKFGQQLGAGGLAGLGAYQGALDQQKKDAVAGMQRQILQMQVDQQRRASDRQQQLDALPGQFYRSPAQVALAGGGGPTQANAQAMQTAQPQFDSQGYGDALMRIDPQMGMAWKQANAREQPKPVLVSDGQTLVDPTTGRPLYQSSPKPMTVGDGQSVIDPATGRTIFAGQQKPITLSEGQVAINPTTGRPMYAAPSRPVALGDSQSLVDPKTGKVVYQPDKGDNSDEMSPEMVRLIGEYKMPAPTGAAALRPGAMALMKAVAQQYPDYDASQYAAKAKAQRDFTTGPLGNSLRSVSTANAHLDQLGALADAMYKSDIPGVNWLVNKYQTATGNPSVTNFNAMKNAVGQEVVKAIVANGGGVHEREEAAKAFNDASSPDQIKGVIAHYRELMQAQADNLLAQRRAAGMPDDTVPAYSGHRQPGAQQNAAQWAGPAGDAAKKQTLKNAQNAILKGAPKAAVISQLEAAGIFDHGLK